MARPRRGTALFRASVQGAGPLARDFDRAARSLQDDLIREMRRVSARVTDIVREHAPLGETGDLRRELTTRFHFRAAAPRFTVVSPVERDGYPYTAVTRFGHRKAIIRPKTARALAVHEGPGRAFSRVALSVRGVGHGTKHTPHDWVAEAMPLVDDEIDRAAARLGRVVVNDHLSGHRIR